MQNQPDIIVRSVFNNIDLVDKVNSLRVDSASIPNFLLAGYRAGTKEPFLVHNGIIGYVLRYAKFNYEFSRDGGAVGTIELKGTPIPAGAVIEPGKIFNHTAFTSGGAATVAVGTRRLVANTDISTTNILGATAFGTIGAAGPVALNTASVNLAAQTEDITVTFTIATAALTAGSSTIYLPYWIPQADASNPLYR